MARPRILSHEQVARAAFDLVDAEGPAALTIGRLARDLGVGPMTLYGYAESKDAIVGMLPELLLADLPVLDASLPWAEAVEGVYLSAYRRMVSHRHVLQAIANSPVFGSAQAHVLEDVLECLVRAGFAPADAFELQRTVATYTVGFAQFAVVAHATAGPRPRTRWVDALDVDEYPRIAEIAGLLDAEVDEGQYLRGLRRVLRGASPG